MMRYLHGFSSFLRNLFHRGRVDRDLNDEVRSHLQMITDIKIAGGLSREEAVRLASIELGGIEQVKENVRDIRMGNLIETIMQDGRYAIRLLIRNPMFTLVAVSTLALGIGANTAIFSIINAVLIKSLPYPDSGRIVAVFESTPTFDRNAVSGGAFKDWRSHATTFAHLAVAEGVELTATGAGNPERVVGMKVSSEYLSVLGIAPSIGRGFAADEDAIGGNNHLVLLTDAFWQSHYAGSSDVIGKTLTLDQVPYTIIGVLPPKALLEDRASFLTPEVVDAPGENWERSGHWRQVIGRLLPGVTAGQAQAELRGIKQQLNAQYPLFKKDWSVTVFPLQEIYAGDARPTLTILLVTTLLVLLIACSNVSNLSVARGNARSREMAIRAAFGASRARIVRQMLVEGLVLSLAGCVAGLLVAGSTVGLLAKMFAGLVPQALHPALDLNVLLFSIIVACASGLVSTILPALRASKANLNQQIKQGERGSVSAKGRRVQSALVVSEFAFALVLLIGAGLFLRSFARLISTDPGFNPNRSIAFDLSFPEARYPHLEDRLQFIKLLDSRLSSLSGVDYAGGISALPFSESDLTEFASLADQPDKNDYLVGVSLVSGDYFDAMGIKLLRGRVITESDNTRQSPPVVVIDQAVARDLFDAQDPIGQPIRFLGKNCQVVGIVAPVHQTGLDADRPRVYAPQSFDVSPVSMVVRSSLPVATVTQMVKQTVREIDPDQPVANIRTLEQAISDSLSLKRTTLILLSLFAFVACSLACVGVYGVMAYAVGQRQGEFGIRSALGAGRGEIVALVLKEGIRTSTAGILVGLVAAFGLSRLVENLLFHVKSHDPLVFLGSVGLLLTVAAFSIYLPARRASRLSPMEALRTE